MIYVAARSAVDLMSARCIKFPFQLRVEIMIYDRKRKIVWKRAQETICRTKCTQKLSVRNCTEILLFGYNLRHKRGTCLQECSLQVLVHIVMTTLSPFMHHKFIFESHFQHADCARSSIQPTRISPCVIKWFRYIMCSNGCRCTLKHSKQSSDKHSCSEMRYSACKSRQTLQCYNDLGISIVSFARSSVRNYFRD